MRLSIFLTCIFNIYLTSLFATSVPPPYLTFNYPREGMFAVTTKVMAALKLYEEGKYVGLKVDFQGKGKYFEKEYGPNWWEYYWEPIELGKNPKDAKLKGYWEEEENIHKSHREFSNQWTREEKHQLFKKYLKLKPEMKDELEKYIKKNFQNDYIIGVHYRGTDKMFFKGKISYERVAKEVSEQVKKFRKNSRKIFSVKNHRIAITQHYKIFVATDEEGFLEFMLEQFPKKVICQEAFRSSDGAGIHHQRTDVSAYERGKEALLDCLLLSNCDLLIKTQSSLSGTSTYINPKIKVIEIEY